MNTYQVIKRDGTKAPFDIHKITAALTKAFEACRKPCTVDVIEMIALRVTGDFTDKVKDNAIGVEDIQDSAEKVLSAAGYADVAKAYILYRKQRENIRNIKSTTLDYKKIVDNYLEAKDEASGVGTYSIGGLILSNSGAITANYWLSEVYDEEIAVAHRNGDIYIHGLGMLTGDSTIWSLEKLIHAGLGGVEGLVSSGPAKHLSTLCIQMADFLGVMQNEWAGMQSFDHFDTYLAPFIKQDALTFKEVKQAMQAFVYEANVPVRRGVQAPASHVILDRMPPADMKEQHAVIGGVTTDILYGDCGEEMEMIDRALCEVLMEGDANGVKFPFPIPVVHIHDGMNAKTEDLLYEMSARTGIPCYLHESRSLDVGSVGIVTIDLPRIAFLSKNEQDMFERLDRMVDLAARCLKTKRTVLEKLLGSGLYPYTGKYLGTLHDHNSSIGIMGLAETCRNASWIQSDLQTLEGKAFACRILQHIRNELEEYERRYNDHYCLVPEEDLVVCQHIAIRDADKYPGILMTAGTYTPGSRLASAVDFFTLLQHESQMQELYDDAPVFEVRIPERLTSFAVHVLVHKIFCTTAIHKCRLIGL